MIFFFLKENFKERYYLHKFKLKKSNIIILYYKFLWIEQEKIKPNLILRKEKFQLKKI